jgi:light-regulated signal transduction histidine kinase (bacteriophytochrome)
MGVDSAVSETTAEDALARARAENERLVTELDRANEGFTQILYAASHDFAEPLQIVLSYSELLASRCAGDLDETGERFLAGIETGARRIRDLIDALQAYSRIGRYPPNFTKVECPEVVGRAQESLGDRIKEAGATVRTGALPTITADILDLELLFRNLLENALKFRSQDPLEIRITAARWQNEWCFSVGDNGIGIDPGQQDRIFEIFQRLHGRDEYPGTGTGLAVCKKVVERHEGRIWVESRLGAGATFHFTIPRQRRPIDSV